MNNASKNEETINYVMCEDEDGALKTILDFIDEISFNISFAITSTLTQTLGNVCCINYVAYAGCGSTEFPRYMSVAARDLVRAGSVR